LKLYKKAIIASVFIVFSCIGLARFAFGMILPNMQNELHLSTTQVGLIGSLNFVGYLAGLFFSSKFYARFGPQTLIKRSLLTQAVSMLMMAILSNYLLISLAYFFTGFFGALANIAIMSYITQLVPKEIRGKTAGIAIIGAGSAIMLSGLIVPCIDTFFGLISWRMSWGLFSLFIFFIAFFTQQGLEFKTKNAITNAQESLSTLTTLLHSSFLKVAFLYLIFGITYVVYVTFFVLAAQTKWYVSTEISGSFWALLGLASIFSGPLFGSIADKIGNFKALGIIFFIQTLANLILSFDTPSAFLWLSAFLFGISTWGVPSIMTVLSGELFGIEQTARILSLITIFFAFGQIIGPIGAGFITDSLGDFSYIFMLSASFTCIGFLSSFYFSRKNLAEK
jgi:MFS family permease